MTDKGQFEQGHEVPVTCQDKPGLQKDMRGQDPQSEHIPTEDGGYQLYKAAGKLEGKKAIITGGDSGIGRATAILFAMEGADSFIAYLPEEEEDAQETKKRVEKYGRKCYTFPTDLVSSKNCKKVVETALEKMGKIDILFNNVFPAIHGLLPRFCPNQYPLLWAAFQQVIDEPIKDLDEEHWVHTFNVNIHPFWYLAKYTVPHMAKGSTIINNASINAYIGRPDLLAYTSTKGAIVSFIRGLHNVVISKGIRVNAIAPDPVWKPKESFTSPLGRPSQPSEIATVVVFLANPDSSSICGQTLYPNGGTVGNG